MGQLNVHKRLSLGEEGSYRERVLLCSSSDLQLKKRSAKKFLFFSYILKMQAIEDRKGLIE